MLRRLPFLLLGLTAICLVVATVVEKICGSDAALSFVYRSPWMTALWTVTAIASAAELIARRRAMGSGSFMLHLALLLILAGAAITHFLGEHGYMTLEAGGPEVTEWTLSSGETKKLPFAISLADCGVVYHPSAIAVRDYFSVVRAGDMEARISMNHILDYQGYRFTQASLGDGRSTLSVSHDPVGRGVTFAAYGLLFLSMVMVLLRGKRFRSLIRKVAAPLLILLPSIAIAQPKTLQKPLARTFGELYVESGGRICPAQTVAREFCVKIHGRDSYRGLTAEQVLTGWIYYYDEWKHEPFIRLTSREARGLVGKDRVALTELFTREGYILEPLLRGSAVSRDLLADDEKVTFISAVVAGRLPRLAGDGDFSLARLREDVSADIAAGRFNSANSRLKELRSLQVSVYSGSLPSETVMRAEHLYNGSCYPLVAAIVAFAGGFAGALGFRRTAVAAGAVTGIYITYILALRWIIGGHIPLATGYETMLSLAWFATVVGLAVAGRLPVVLPMGLLVSGASMMVAMMSSRNPAVSPLVPVLASRLLSLHVMLVMCSYALFAIIALNSAAGLAGRGRTDISRLMLYPALFLLGAGIFVGAIWADRSWGRYWGWDPKETWALITFIVYAFPLHDTTFKVFRSDRFLNIYLILSFLSVLMTYFGVNYLLGGLHSYGAS